MGNCLVTKLKGSVSSSLPRMGEIILPPVAQSYGVENGLYVSISSVDNVTMKDLDGNFYGKEYNEVTGTYIEETLPIGHRLSIFSKYGLTVVNMAQAGGSAFTNDKGIPSIKEFLYCNNLGSLLLNGFDITLPDNLLTRPTVHEILFSCCYGNFNLDSIYRIWPNVTSLRFTHSSKINGILSDLSQCTGITNLMLGECENVSGSIEDFVIGQRTNGRESCGGISCEYFSHSKVTFNGNNITNNDTTLSWIPNVSDPTKTDITFGGVTITV